VKEHYGAPPIEPRTLFGTGMFKVMIDEFYI